MPKEHCNVLEGHHKDALHKNGLIQRQAAFHVLPPFYTNLSDFLGTVSTHHMAKLFFPQTGWLTVHAQN